MFSGDVHRPLVHIVDDDDAVRNSLDFLLRNAGYHRKCWISGDEFLGKVDRLVPACVLLDIRMPGRDGLSIHRAMKEEGLDFPVIILTGHGEIDLAVLAMKGGAYDFVEKPFDRERLLASLSMSFIAIGDAVMLADRALRAKAQLDRLTEREREVLDGLACGYPNKTIAFDLGISSRTVEVYRANVMTKLGVASFADALRIAFAGGLGSQLTWQHEHGQSSSRLTGA